MTTDPENMYCKLQTKFDSEKFSFMKKQPEGRSTINLCENPFKKLK